MNELLLFVRGTIVRNASIRRERRSLNDRSEFTQPGFVLKLWMLVAIFRAERIYHRQRETKKFDEIKKKRNNVSYRICAYIYYYHRQIKVINDSMNFINQFASYLAPSTRFSITQPTAGILINSSTISEPRVRKIYREGGN